jgi:hypothetical protein
VDRFLCRCLPRWFDPGRPFTSDDVYAHLLDEGFTGIDPIELYEALETLVLQAKLERKRISACGGRPCVDAYVWSLWSGH